MQLPVYHGDRLRAMRQALHYTEEDVERISKKKISQPDVSKWERNQSVPGVEELAQLGIIYGKRLTEMLATVFDYVFDDVQDEVA